MLPVMLRAKLASLRSNRAVRSAGTLVGGAAAGQLLAVVALPFLTRLYSPTDFSVLAVYSAALLMIAVAATGRFELAIPLPDSDEEAAHLLVLSILSTVMVALLLALVLWLFGSAIVRAASAEAVEPYLWLLPLGVFLNGSFIALQYWWIRRKAFRRIAQTRFTQVATGLADQLAMGALGWRPVGLLVGHLLLSGAGSVKFLVEFCTRDRQMLANIRPDGLWRCLKQYRNFPQFSVIDTFATNARSQLPLIIIAALATGPAAGLLLLTTRILGAPVQLVASAISQVYHSETGTLHREGRLNSASEKVVRALMLYGATPVLFGSLAVAPLFGLVFGSEWAGAGQLMIWVAPWYALRLITQPIGNVAAVLGRQRLIMFVKIGTLIVSIASVYIGFFWWDGRAAEALAIAGIVNNLILMYFYYSLAGVRVRRLGALFVVAPIVAGALGLLVARLLTQL